MSFTTWTPHAVASERRLWQGQAWRMVEAQHVASTMKLVDSQAEQHLLEELLESSKPTLPLTKTNLHYLVQAPFRYPPPPGGSRFRAPNDSGVFYGADCVRTSCAELGYWRWRFVQDADDLSELPPVAHTAFCIVVQGQQVDLRCKPFVRDSKAWMDPNHYSATQAFASVARESAVDIICYQSVRDPSSGWCVAVFNPEALAPPPEPATQTWWLAVRADVITCKRDQGQSYSFSADELLGGGA